MLILKHLLSKTPPHENWIVINTRNFVSYNCNVHDTEALPYLIIEYKRLQVFTCKVYNVKFQNFIE